MNRALLDAVPFNQTLLSIQGCGRMLSAPTGRMGSRSHSPNHPWNGQNHYYLFTLISYLSPRSGRFRVIVCVTDAKKASPIGETFFSLCWHYLSSRQVTLQVLSAQMSLTSVFGMGTGGPSSQSIPTMSDGFAPSLLCQNLSLGSNRFVFSSW